MKTLLTSLRALIVLSVLTGVIYPLAITGIASQLFPAQARGSLVLENGVVRGSTLIAQKFTGATYFHPRPSAADYATVASGASNQGFTSAKLLQAVRERQADLGPDAPPDLLYASASGLDPDISPEAARYQAPRVAAARNLPLAAVLRMIDANTEDAQFGFLGQPRVRVLKLNLALDAAK